MQSQEIRDAGRFASVIAGGGMALVADLHGAIAGRVFGAGGAAAEPVRVAHDRITDVTYGLWRSAFGVVPRVAGEVGAVLAGDSGSPLGESKVGAYTLGVVNGLYGDFLAEKAPGLAVPMSIRSGEIDVELTRGGVVAAFPGATSHVAVFVHGLCENEHSWRPNDEEVNLGARLLAEAGCTPVFLRYNSGRRVSDNGEDLANLAGQRVEHWPVAIEELSLIGHSMGGLVARSAAHVGDERGAEWVERLSNVICLGSPHLGAPLERGTNAVAHVLSRVPETRGIARVLNARSVGIKDLRFGSVRREDWDGVDPDEFLTDRCQETPFAEGADYYFVAATVTRDARHPLGTIVGDFLVHHSSATGKGEERSVPFDPERGHHIGGIHHFELLTHPEVADQLVEWLT